MTLIHEVPTHLGVDDTLLFGLTPRQLLRLSVGATLAYFLWDQTSVLPAVLRDGVAAALVVFGVLLALFQPGGRPLDQWILVALLFLALPRRRVWRLEEHDWASARTIDTREWAELSPVPAWVGADDDDQGVTSVSLQKVRNLNGRPSS